MRHRRVPFGPALVLGLLTCVSLAVRAQAASPASSSAAPAATAAPPPSAVAPAAASKPSAPPALFLPRPPAVDKLPNGLTVVTVPFASPGVVAFYTLVRAGSRDEVEPSRSGYAHLFEHLMFRGTDKIPAAEYERRMQALGADNNAFTTDDFTLYVPTIPKESLGELVPIEADRFQHLNVARPAYKDETGAVLGEFNKDFSSPAWVIDEALRALAFKAHTYGHTTIGYKRDVEAMPTAYDYSRSFFKRFYTPDDATLFAVGDVDRAKVLELVRANYAGWTGTRATTTVKTEPEQSEARKKALTWKSATVPRLAVGYKIPATSASVRDAAALIVLSTLVFGESSELYQRLVVEQQKLIDLSCDPDDALHRDPGLFRVDAKLRPGVDFDEILVEIEEALTKVQRGEVPADRIAAVRKHVENATLLGLQTPSAVAERLAFWTAVTGDVHAFETFGRELPTIDARDLARVAKNLVPAKRNVVTLTPPATKPAAPVRSTGSKGGAK